MTNEVVRVGSPIPPPVSSVPPTFFDKVTQVAKVGLEAAQKGAMYAQHEWLSPPNPPRGVLSQINEVANQGIRNAKNIETPLRDSPVATLHGAIDTRLASLQKKQKEDSEKAKKVGDIARGPHGIDPERTRPISFGDQAVERKQNARAVIPAQKEDLFRLGVVFVTFSQMLSYSGIVEANNADFLELVQQGVRADVTRSCSIWGLFVNKYKPNWTEKIQAGFVYWLYYKTSLLEKGIKTYGGIFLNAIDPETVVRLFSDPKNQTLTDILRAVLENANDFLLDDLQATKQFGSGQGSGDLETRRKEAIRRKYNSKEELCKRFSQAIIQKYSPQIPIFEDLQKVRFIGWVFKKFEVFVNRFFIQKVMSSFLLPKISEKLLAEGRKLTHPDNLAFASNLTQFFTQQLEQLKDNLNRKQTPSNTKSSKSFPGTELLSATVKNLVLAIALEPFDTPEGVSAQLKKLQSSPPLWDLYGNWEDSLDKQVTASVEASIVESSHILFDYLSQSAQNGELFSQLLKICIDSFKPRRTHQADLESDYREKKATLDRTAHEVLKKIVSKTVSEKFEGPNPQNSQMVATSSFTAQSIVIKEGVSTLKAICGMIQEKVQKAAQEPLANDIQPEIVSSLEILQALASRKEIQEELQNIKTRDQKAIWDVITPIFSQIARIEQRLVHLQKLYYHYASDAEITEAYGEIRALLEENEQTLSDLPLHSTPSTSFQKHLEKVKKRFGEESSAYKKGKAFAKQIETCLIPVAKEQERIEALTEFHGLSMQFIQFKKGKPTRGFQPKKCLLEMVRLLKFLPASERRTSERITGVNGNTLLSNENLLTSTIETLKKHYEDQKKIHIEPLKKTIEEAKMWATALIGKYEELKPSDYATLQAETRHLSLEMGCLEKEVQSMHLNLSSLLSPEQKTKLYSTYLPRSAAVIAALGGFSLPIAIGAGAATKYVKGLDDSSTDFAKKLSATAAAAYVMPAAAPAAAFYAGWIGIQKIKSHIETSIQNRVLTMFESAYSLALKERIYQMILTRFMLNLSK